MSTYESIRQDRLVMKRPADQRRLQRQELVRYEIERQAYNVLVVDDEIQMCEILSLYLGWKGFNVRTAHSPGEALHHASQYEFDLIMLDWNLAGVESLDLLNFFKGTTPQTPVIIFTGKEVDEAFLKKMLHGKADAILYKLGSLDTLWKEIVKQLSNRDKLPDSRSLIGPGDFRDPEG